MTKNLVIIGAGIGGLTTAAVLAQAGLNVTVLEAHIYPGGSAGTFYHKGYRFDAGATLAGGFYPGGPMDLVAQAAGIEAWPVREANPAMVVHLSDGATIMRRADEQRWEARREAFGAQAETFWRWQEHTADQLWDLALRQSTWPPQTPGEAVRLAKTGLNWLADNPGERLHPELIADAFRPAAHHLKGAPERLRQFVDGQLLISTQTTSQYANALYSASALDLPRRGVVHTSGGMGGIAETLVQAIRAHGRQVLYRQQVDRIVMEKNKPVVVETKRGDTFPADIVIANLTPWNIRKLLEDNAPPRLRHLPERPQTGWGAFMVYVGIDGNIIPDDSPLHYQVIVREPLGEGNSVFISISPDWDHNRSPEGHRAVTISTHTDLNPWWDLFELHRPTYEVRKAAYVDRILIAAETALPRLRDAAELVMPGTPVTFQRFTRRQWGWVGGFPQTDLFQSWGPRIAPNLWMVGDSIFPGQSTTAVALGGLRVANTLLHEIPRGNRGKLNRPSTRHRRRHDRFQRIG